MTFKFRYILFGVLVLVSGLVFPALAQDEPDTTDAIIEFLVDLPNPLETATTDDERNSATIQLMGEITESIFNSNIARLETALRDANRAEGVSEVHWASTIALAEDVLAVSRAEAEPDSLTGDALLDFLEQYENEENWYAESIVRSLTAFRYFTRNQTLISARHVRDAMELIPTELSDLATDARLRASEVSMLLYGVQGNPAFLLDAAKVQREVKSQLGERVDRFELMNNFIYAFNRVRDFRSAARVAELLLQEEPSKDTIPGLAEGYMAITFNELSNYERAKALAEKALDVGDHPLVLKRANYELVVALSGLGQDEDAHAIMRELGWDYDHDELLNLKGEQAILHAEALIAMHRSEAEMALALMKHRTDLLVQRVQSSNSSDMTSLLTNLENTRGRQAERETALQREAELRAEQLKQKNRLNRLLWVLIALLTIAFNLLLAFLRYREKLSGKVQGLQKEALSAEKMKTEFLGVINHELRTPLNGIIGISDAMIHHADDPNLKAQAETVQESGQLLFDLLDSLITMSTIEGDRLSLEASQTDLSKVIAREAAEWEDAAREKGLHYTYHVAPELSELLLADEKRLRQCVRYLLSNAMRFTHEGRVHLHATAEPGEAGFMGVKIIVADTGQGMNTDVQSRLFKPFLQAEPAMTRKYGGAGLSLAIARKMVRMMDGDLTVTSREGRGSEFVLTANLPIAAQTDLEGMDPDLIPALALDHLSEPEAIIDLMLDQQLGGAVPVPQEAVPTILLADTGGPGSRDLRRALNGLGCNLIEAGSGRTLLKRLKNGSFDAVLLNLRLRHLDAEATSARIRAMDGPIGDVPIIALGADMDMDDHQALRAAGIGTIIARDADRIQIEAALAHALGTAMTKRSAA